MEVSDRIDQNATEPANNNIRNFNDLPNYTEATPETDARATIKALTASAIEEGLTLPLGGSSWDPFQTPRANSIISSFHNAVGTKKDEVVAMMIEEGLVSANTINFSGETPLLRAVREGNTRMVQELMDFDADVNAFGACLSTDTMHAPHRSNPASKNRPSWPERTPLQLAAHMGNLNLVKLLMEVYHADDSLIAPDGALALRLAANHGHKDIVAYLPQRRGGGWLRWKFRHAVAVDRAKKAAVYIGLPFYFLLWVIPRAICVGLWENRVEIAREIKNMIISIPSVAAEVTRKTWRAIKNLPSLAKRGMAALGRGAKSILGVVKKTPQALMVTGKWLWQGVCGIAQSFASILTSVASFLHTLGIKLLNALSGLTWVDVRNGFYGICRAIFVTFPTALLSWLQTFGQFSYDVLKTLLNETGKCLWWIGFFLIHVVLFIPGQLARVIAAFGTSVSKAFEEILVFFDPKRV